MLSASLFDTIGLAPKAAHIYSTLLKLGPSSVRDIAKAADMNRGTTFEILKVLQEKGLVSFFHGEAREHFVAEDPERLHDLVRERRHALADAEETLKIALPELKSLHDRGGEKPIAKYFSGEAGVREILEDVLVACGSSAKEYCVYSAAGIRDHLYRGYPRFSEERIARGITVKVIALGEGGDLRGLDARKWIPANLTHPTYLIIYSRKVAAIALDAKGALVGVIIENEGIAETHKAIFMHLWETIGEAKIANFKMQIAN